MLIVVFVFPNSTSDNWRYSILAVAAKTSIVKPLFWRNDLTRCPKANINSLFLILITNEGDREYLFFLCCIPHICIYLPFLYLLRYARNDWMKLVLFQQMYVKQKPFAGGWIKSLSQAQSRIILSPQYAQLAKKISTK